MKACLIFALISLAVAQRAQVLRARAILFRSRAGDLPGEVVGVVDFDQVNRGVRLNGTINGLTAGLHGFHVHERGDLSNGCLASGGHYNPFNRNHGAQNATIRHRGDLGNIVSPISGATNIRMSDSLLTLNGRTSVVGRALVVHERPDDLGLGGVAASLTTGDAGARWACGIIGTEGKHSPFSYNGRRLYTR